MRTIKFRAWDKDKNIMRKITSINWYDEYLWVDETPLSGDRLPFASTPIMQFTGLTDKNGKEIYEGDIVKTKYQPLAEIIWHEEFACFCYKTIDETVEDEIQFNFKQHEIELIGNIHENPELLTP